MKRRVPQAFLAQWFILGMALIVIGILIANDLYSGYRQVGRREGEHLLSQARIIDANLGAELGATAKVLAALRRDALTPGAVSNERLRVLENAISGVRTLLVTDAEGRVRHSNRSEIIGHGGPDRPYFAPVRANPNPSILFLSSPFETVLGIWSVSLSLAIIDRDGKFRGVVSATLDPAYFQTVMKPVNYADDGWTYIAHGDGLLFLMVPEQSTRPGKDLAKPDTFFTRHRESGQSESLFAGVAYVTGEERLMALRTVQPPQLAMNNPLMVAVSRDLRAVYAEWRREARTLGLLFAAIAAIAVTALVLFQRRQRAQLAQVEGADARARQHARDLQSVLDNLPSMIGYWDRNLRNRFGNHAYRTWFGIDPDKMPGMDIRDVIGAERYRLNLPYIEGALRGEPQIFERAIPTPDGKEVRHSLSHYIPDIVDGQVQGFYVLVSDITAVKRAEEALQARERQYRALTEASAQIVWTCNNKGEACEDSPSWRAYTGQTVDQWLGHGYVECIHPDDRPAVMQRWQAALTMGETVTNEYRLRHRSGEWRWNLARGVPIHDEGGAIVSWVGMNTDIHEQKTAALALQAAKEAAEAASLAKSQFLATMSHEIRTPMNGILGMAQLLLQPGLSEELRADYARTVLSSGQTLLTLLNDILDISRIEAGRLELMHAVFDPAQIVAESASLFAAPAHDKRLRIEANWLGPRFQRYWADPIRLRQMIANLISNAIKFSEHGCIRVEATEVKRDANHAELEFAVTDEGIGIPADKLALLFRPFSQVDASSTRRFGGTGLGLSIVRSLAELMDGNVGVDSRPGQGSRFWFRIQVGLAAAEEESRTRAEIAPAIGAGEGYILIAEDDPVNQRVVEGMLGKSGFHIRSVADGQGAVGEVMTGKTPDLILMDCQMPGMDGYEATRRIREWERANGRAPIPILALTASAFDNDRHRCLEVGMDDFLTKPLHIDDLAQLLTKWIGKRPRGDQAA